MNEIRYCQIFSIFVHVTRKVGRKIVLWAFLQENNGFPWTLFFYFGRKCKCQHIFVFLKCVCGHKCAAKMEEVEEEWYLSIFFWTLHHKKMLDSAGIPYRFVPFGAPRLSPFIVDLLCAKKNQASLFFVALVFSFSHVSLVTSDVWFCLFMLTPERVASRM